eukprot:TRINITY_DN5198_c0_g1_i1.p1 TRINITY_DN5198_c0_g1~~TRINITY_DN5198_c0_g1_i1.p1  ORF type:complete len:340 (-),score=72.50 TRINITY_DN5198_c0_g1_i1:70-1089(-)
MGTSVILLSIVVCFAFLAGPAAAWWKPVPGTSWQWQLMGAVDTTVDVQVYDIDLWDTPAATISTLHAAGRRVVCYFSAGTYENWRSDASKFPAAILGKALPDWPGERWLDLRNFQASGLAAVMAARMDMAVQKGCDGLEPDNIDGYQNPSGFPMSAADQLAYNTWLANAAHERGLAIGLKNDLEQVTALVGLFDFVVNEQCNLYNECNMLKPFVAANKPVWGCSYQEDGTKSSVANLCPSVNALNFDWIIKTLDLKAKPLTQCRTYVKSTPTPIVVPTVSPKPSVTVSPQPSVSVSPKPSVSVSPVPSVSVAPSPTVSVAPPVQTPIGACAVLLPQGSG